MVRGLLSKHIDDGIINIKKKNGGADKKLSPLSKNYSNYLNKNNKRRSNTRDKMKIDDIKINIIKKENPALVKKKAVAKVEKPIVVKKKVEAKVEKPTVVKKKVGKPTVVKKKVEKPTPTVITKNKVSKPDAKEEPIAIKKRNSKRSNRRISKKSKKRSSKRRKTLHKKHTKSRRISFRCYPQKDNVNIDKMLKKVEKMSDENIKKELLKNGIEIKTNNNKLLKDMYMFSNMGGIRINKE
jgi:hypothetical protein|tara:strand:- start:4342 stop:5061 length:720 start_codon:yes stop_codon:yes gene_type:complete